MEGEKILKYLKQIAKNTSPKVAKTIIVTDDKTDFEVIFNPPLELDNNKQYQIALLDLETYYSFPNVDEKNNQFNYRETKSGYNPLKTINIPTGAHEIDSVMSEINKQLIANGDEGAISLTFSQNTMLTTMTIKPGYEVDFEYNNTIGKMFGFTKPKYEEGVFQSEKIINILSVNSIFIHLDLISGSYVNGIPKQVIYSFFPKISPGGKIIQTPNKLAYFPVTRKTINSIRIQITDQNNKLLNLRGEDITIRFHIKEV
jgi:hypothetical protein